MLYRLSLSCLCIKSNKKELQYPVKLLTHKVYQNKSEDRNIHSCTLDSVKALQIK